MLLKVAGGIAAALLLWGGVTAHAATLKHPTPRQQAATWAGAVKGPLTAEDTAFEDEGQDCQADLVAACDADMTEVLKQAHGVEAAQAKHPAPACLATASSTLEAAEAQVIQATTDEQNGLEAGDTDLMEQGANELSGAVQTMGTATTQINQERPSCKG